MKAAAPLTCQQFFFLSSLYSFLFFSSVIRLPRAPSDFSFFFFAVALSLWFDEIIYLHGVLCAAVCVCVPGGVCVDDIID